MTAWLAQALVEAVVWASTHVYVFFGAALVCLILACVPLRKDPDNSPDTVLRLKHTPETPTPVES